MYIIFGLCLQIACIFLSFLAANLNQDFCLGSVHSSSFSVGLYASFLRFGDQYLSCVRHINLIAFSFDYIMLFCTNYSNLVLHSFSQYYLPRFNMCIFNYSICLLCVIFSNRQVFTQIPVRQLHLFSYKSLIEVSQKCLSIAGKLSQEPLDAVLTLVNG